MRPGTGINDVPSNAYELIQIPGGLAGTAATIEVMKQKVLSDYQHQRIVQLARMIVAGQGRKDHVAELEALFDWVKEHVRYIEDPADLELVSGASYTIFVEGQGDCDDHAVVMAALAKAIGRPVAFRTVGADPSRPREFSHVYAMIGAGQPVQWYAADTAEGDRLGWEPPGTWNPSDWLVP